ncbi:hypothetical protein Hanom_Chr04g00370331 [Helianthus anomalus]
MIFLQFAITAAIITVCTMGTLFQYSDKTLVFVYFFMFGLSGIMLSSLISTFFTRAKSAMAVGTLAVSCSLLNIFTNKWHGKSNFWSMFVQVLLLGQSV